MTPSLRPEPAQVQGRICRLLATEGPLKAWSIARALGMEKSKDVKPHLYEMQKEHLLHLDKKSNTWEIYQPGTPRAGSRRPPTVYQQNMITICQSGPHSCISIANSEAVQIGHGNSMVKHVGPAESGSAAPLCLPPPPAAGPRAPEPPAGPWGPQDIHIDSSMLRCVQLGHGNQMTLLGAPATGPGHSPPAAAGPGASFEIRMPPPGPHPEGQGDAAQGEEEGDAAQRVLIKSCLLEESAIGSGNSLSARPWAAGLGAGPGASRGHPGQPGKDAAPRPGAAEPGAQSPEGAGPADPDLSAFTAHLAAMTLENRDPEAPEDSP